METSSDDLPDELPLSESLPSPSGIVGEPTCENESLPDELPLSEAGDGECATQRREAENSPLPDQLPLSDTDSDAFAEPPQGAPRAQPPVQERSLWNRKGRKDPLMLQALAAAEVAMQQSESSAALCAHEGPVSGPPSRAPSSKPDLQALVAATRVSAACTTDLLPKCVGGFNLESPLPAALASARLVARLDARALDTEARAIADHFLQDTTMPLASKRIVCDLVSVEDRKLDRVVPRLAAVLLNFERMHRRELESAISFGVPASGKMLFLEVVSYDETPLPVQLRNDQLAFQDKPSVQEEGSQSVAGAERMASFSRAPTLKLTTKTSPQKILQHTQAAGYLLRIDGRFVLLRVQTLNNLTVMESGTAEVLKSCQQRLSASTRATKSFVQHTRGVCTDGGSANLACERALSGARGDGGKTVHVLCEVHKTSLIHGKTFSLISDNIKGMVACALSLRNGSAMGKFRQCLMDEIDSRLEILHGRPSPEAVAHKEAVFRLFVAHGRHLAVRRLLLAMCPNGDWRSPKVQYYVPLGAGPAPDRPTILRHLTTGLVTALCSCRPEIYPNHRWTGCDLATDDLGRIEAVHQLLSTTYRRFVAEYQAGWVGLRPPMATGSSADLVGLAPLEDAPALAPGSSVAPYGGDLTNVAAGAGEVAGAQQSWGSPDTAGLQPGEATDWARINAAHRRHASMWLSQDPFAFIVLQRLVLEPLRQLLTEQFRIAAAAWETEQQCRAAAALERGEAGINLRQYRLPMAAGGHFEAPLKQQVELLWASPSLWALIPVEKYTISFRALCFKCISRLACTSHQLLEWPHKCFPIQLFILIERPELAPNLAELPDCLLDEWSLQMREMHPEFAGEEFMHKLLLCSLLLANDISSVESKHASIRRVFTASSVQSHAQALHDLSAQWAFMQARNRKGQFAPWETARTKKALLRKAQKDKRQAARKARLALHCSAFPMRTHSAWAFVAKLTFAWRRPTQPLIIYACKDPQALVQYAWGGRSHRRHIDIGRASPTCVFGCISLPKHSVSNTCVACDSAGPRGSRGGHGVDAERRHSEGLCPHQDLRDQGHAGPREDRQIVERGAALAERRLQASRFHGGRRAPSPGARDFSKWPHLRLECPVHTQEAVEGLGVGCPPASQKAQRAAAHGGDQRACRATGLVLARELVLGEGGSSSRCAGTAGRA